jgi:hypothetical protein
VVFFCLFPLVVGRGISRWNGRLISIFCFLIFFFLLSLLLRIIILYIRCQLVVPDSVFFCIVRLDVKLIISCFFFFAFIYSIIFVFFFVCCFICMCVMRVCMYCVGCLCLDYIYLCVVVDLMVVGGRRWCLIDVG